MKIYIKNGFSVLELTVSMFLIAIILGVVLLLMAGNLNTITKANEIMVANALTQYTIEEVKNIDFPPVYYNERTYGDRPIQGSSFKKPEEINYISDGKDWTPLEFQNQFKVKKFDFRYNSNGNQLITDITGPDTDSAMLHRIDIYILRKKDNALISKTTTYISRNGKY